MTEEQRTVSAYIVEMAENSRTRAHEEILKCLEHYGITGTRELTVQQAKEWCERYQKNRGGSGK